MATMIYECEYCGLEDCEGHKCEECGREMCEDCFHSRDGHYYCREHCPAATNDIVITTNGTWRTP